MSPFLKLTTRVINKLHINNIFITPNKYYIYMNNNNISGFFLFAFGTISNQDTYMVICEEKHKQDYDIIAEFIKELK